METPWREVNQHSISNHFVVAVSTISLYMFSISENVDLLSVVGDEFVSDPVKFSNQSTTFGEVFSNFSSRSNSKKGTSLQDLLGHMYVCMYVCIVIFCSLLVHTVCPTLNF